MRKQEKGITLVALIITIIILLILAGITISQLTQNELFKNVKLTKEKYQNEQEKENAILDEYENAIIGADRNETGLPEIDANNFELIGKDLGSTITITSGYKYVIIVNEYVSTASSSLQYSLDHTILLNNSNSNIIINDSLGLGYRYATTGGWLIFAKINNTKEDANFEFSGSDYNIVYGIK